MSVDHPNIVKFYEVYEDELFMHLVMELCRGGDLLEHLCNSNVYTEATAAKVLSKLLAGVNHLHHQHFAHRDLKPENFLFTTNKPDAEIKLVDFGLAVKFEPGVPMKSLVGTPYFVAPEVLRGRYSNSCDVWSLGIVFYMMLTGEPPFTGRNVTEVYQKASMGVIDFSKPEFENISPEAKDLLSKMLNVSPRTRISLDDALGHKFFLMNADTNTQRLTLSAMSNLKRWHAPQLLQREALKVILKMMTPESIEELKNAFVAMDRKGTGFITVEELKQALAESGLKLASDEIGRVISSFDYSENGRINYSEFLLATLDKKQVLDEAALHTAFKFFDIDNSGHISIEDITNALIRTGVTVPKEELTGIVNKWGRGATITYEQFKKMMSAIEVEASPLRLAEDGSLVSTFFLSPKEFSAPSSATLEVIIDTSS
eukprot:CAMPEP_0204917440 /NCGR_PEP_ID=MMETSP1397-20131031/15017_1 /ASSEMBLY_ACC=CAM_ASM_000891 /TAXON_ID=49980 /ORGANISM="Climacostomum Climacostomum virens, Strain Stock W-24" /LENGTH=428 /DNA_ID=CAMNT_0052090271 /DNA_START=488 /DNA_END=1774 /DNA_ORIENTATION=+